MCLNWDVTNVAEYETACFYIAGSDDVHGQFVKGDRLLQNRTKTLILLTMSIGMGEITEDNHREFFTRVALYERLFGASRSRFNGKARVRVHFTLAEIREHIGLTTNVSLEKNNCWTKRIVENFNREVLTREEG